VAAEFLVYPTVMQTANSSQAVRSPRASGGASIFLTRKVLLLGAIVAFLFALYLRAALFIVSIEYLPPITDEAINMLMAGDIARGNYPLLFWTQPYQFPLEAYLLSLFIDYLPPNAFGARVILASIGCLSLLGFGLIYRYRAPIADCWPGLLLVCVPSSYLLLRQAAFIIPQYTSTITCAWLLPLLFVLSRRDGASLAWVFFGGVAAGIAVSTHLLLLSLVVASGVAFCASTSFRGAVRNSVAFCAGASLGLIPYLVAMRIPNAYQKVTDTLPLMESLARLWDPVITRVLPVTLGATPITFPDLPPIRYTNFVSWFSYIFLAVLLVVTLLRVFRLLKLVWQREWISLDVEDIFLGTTWGALLLAAVAGFGTRYRYLLPVAWSFPFLVGYLFMATKSRWLRSVVAVVALFLVYVHTRNAFATLRAWEQPGVFHNVGRMPQIAPLLAHLEKTNTTHCYGAWWLVYRIPYESGGKITCSQSYNERFPGWTLTPLLEQVDRHANTPYVLQRNGEGVFKPAVFEELLNQHHLEANREIVGAFAIYRDIRSKSGKAMVRHEPTISVRVGAAQTSSFEVADGLIDTRAPIPWSSNDGTVEMTFSSPIPVEQVRLYTLGAYENRFHVDLLEEQGWVRALSNVQAFPHRIKTTSPHRFPGHRYEELSFGFEPRVIRGLRLIPVVSKRQASFALQDIEVYGPVADR
jgi:hypothetical protein